MKKITLLWCAIFAIAFVGSAVANSVDMANTVTDNNQKVFMNSPVNQNADLPTPMVNYLSDDFEDGDYTLNPTWTNTDGGTGTAAWMIVPDPWAYAWGTVTKDSLNNLWMVGVDTDACTCLGDEDLNISFNTPGGGGYLQLFFWRHFRAFYADFEWFEVLVDATQIHIDSIGGGVTNPPPVQGVVTADLSAFNDGAAHTLHMHYYGYWGYVCAFDDVVITDEEPVDYDMELVNIMKVLEPDECYVAGGPFSVAVLVFNNSLLTDNGNVTVTVTPGGTLVVPFGPLGPGAYEWVYVGPFNLPPECDDFSIYASVAGQPIDINPANNEMEIFNTSPCVCTDLVYYDDNATLSNGVGYYAFQFGSAYHADFPGYLCAFEVFLTGGGGTVPFYIHVWEDTDGDMIPDVLLYTGHYAATNTGVWDGTYDLATNCTRHCGPLCLPVVQSHYYWIMVQQKHYDDLGMLPYVCIDGDGWTEPNSQWYYDGAIWVNGWGYDADPFIRANFKYVIPQFDLECDVTCVSQYVPCVDGVLYFDLEVTNVGTDPIVNVVAEIYPTIGDCASPFVLDVNWYQTIANNLASGATFYGYYYLLTGGTPDRCSLPQLCGLTVDVGDARDNYFDRCCDNFFFYHPWGGRMGEGDIVNMSWDDAEWGERGDMDILPSVTALGQNYPNPFNANTVIPFDLASDGNVSLRVYNLAGQLVETLVDGQMSAGHHTVDWDASTIASGVYFYKLQIDDYVTTRKMNLLK